MNRRYLQAAARHNFHLLVGQRPHCLMFVVIVHAEQLVRHLYFLLLMVRDLIQPPRKMSQITPCPQGKIVALSDKQRFRRQCPDCAIDIIGVSEGSTMGAKISSPQHHLA
jgi:hypothetical protein